MDIELNGRTTPGLASVRARHESAVAPAVIAWVAACVLLATEMVAITLVAFPARASGAPFSAQGTSHTLRGSAHGVVVNRVALSLDGCTASSIRPRGPITRTRNFSDDFRQEVDSTTVILDATC